MSGIHGLPSVDRGVRHFGDNRFGSVQLCAQFHPARHSGIDGIVFVLHR